MHPKYGFWIDLNFTIWRHKPIVSFSDNVVFLSQVNVVMKFLCQCYCWFWILKKFLCITDLIQDPEIENPPPSISSNICWLRQVTATNLSWVSVIFSFEIAKVLKLQLFCF